MKGAAILIAFSLGVSFGSGQGTVTFHNTASPNYRLWTNNFAGTASNLMSGTDAFRIGLYASTDLNAYESTLSLVLLATNAAAPSLAGYFNGGSTAVLSGIASGSQIRFQVRAWSLWSGNTYEESIASGRLGVFQGVSPLGATTLGGGLVVPGQLFGTAPGLLHQGFGIVNIPEPSASALALLGATALWVGRNFRRSNLKRN